MLFRPQNFILQITHEFPVKNYPHLVGQRSDEVRRKPHKPLRSSAARDLGADGIWVTAMCGNGEDNTIDGFRRRRNEDGRAYFEIATTLKRMIDRLHISKVMLTLIGPLGRKSKVRSTERESWADGGGGSLRRWGWSAFGCSPSQPRAECKQGSSTKFREEMLGHLKN